MSRALRPVLVLTILVALAAFTPATAGPEDTASHSINVRQVAHAPIMIDAEKRAQGSDLAFQGDTVVAGSYQGTALFRIAQRFPRLRQTGFHFCPGSQGDVSVWGMFAFVSIDAPGSNNVESATCNNTDGSLGKEGIRVIDISDPDNIRQVKFIETDCGSHTHTLNPGPGGVLYIYVQSYPLGAPTPTCNVGSHRKTSIVRFDPEAPSTASVVGTIDVSPAIGCHDVTVFKPRDLAVAACITESQIWDVKDPANPIILGRIYNPVMEIHHSSSVTWDGKVAALGDEAGGAAAGGCTGRSDTPYGAMWFYDITDPSAPKELGYHALPRMFSVPDSSGEATRPRCTTHNYNVLPRRIDNRYVAAVSYYAGGMALIDFTDPKKVREIGFYVPQEAGVNPDMWSAYWYNGRIFTNEHGSAAGVRMFSVRNFGPFTNRNFEVRLNPQLQIADFDRAQALRACRCPRRR